VTSTKGENLKADTFVYSSETKEADMYGNKTGVFVSDGFGTGNCTF